MKKGKTSSWRYNPGVGRTWLNEGEETPEAPEVYSEDEGARLIEHPTAAVNTEEMEQLSARVRNMSDAGGHAPVEDEPVVASGFEAPVQAAPVHFEMPHAASTHFEMPKTVEHTVVVPKTVEHVFEAPSTQRFTPPTAQSAAPVMPPQQTHFTPPLNAHTERPHIPAAPAYKPHIPPTPAAPTTQRIAERLAQQRTESYWATTPAAGPEVTPIVAAAAAPIVEKSAEPVFVRPPEPVYEKPAAPVFEKHVAPVFEKPAEPVFEKHPEPVFEKPATPTVEEPLAPQPTFVSKPFHPETYFAAQEGAVRERTTPVPEPIVTPRVEAVVETKPAHFEVPATPRPEVIHAPRYAAAAQVAPTSTAPIFTAPIPTAPVTPAPVTAAPISAAPVQERVIDAVHERVKHERVVAEDFFPERAVESESRTAAAQKQEAEMKHDEQLKHEEQIAQRVAAERAADLADERAAREIARKVAAQAASAKAAAAQVHADSARHETKAASAPRSTVPARLTSGERPSGLTRTLNAIRAALPLVQRLLPLLEGNVAKAVSNLLGQVPDPDVEKTPPTPPVDLVPMQRGLAEIQKQHRELREQLTTQNVSLQRVEDQLSHVATATDRNTREQQELVEEIQAMGKRQSRFSTIVVILLLISIAANVLLYLLMKHVIQ